MVRPAVAFLLIFALMVSGFVWLFQPQRATVRVSRMHWARVVVLEEQHDYTGEGWRDLAPSEVYVWDHCASRQRGLVDCHPHDCRCRQMSYDCRCTGGDTYPCDCHPSCQTACTSNRNGSARCTERCRDVCRTCRTPRRCDTCQRTLCDTCYDRCPTYSTWCTYRYHQWDVLAVQRREGEGLEAEWPSLSVNAPNQRVRRDEQYGVQFADVTPPRTWSRNFPYARYRTFHVGDRWEVTWTQEGGFTLLERR